MKQSWSSSLFVLLALVLACVSADASDNELTQSHGHGHNKHPLSTCIDDSDCVKLGEGNKYRCFMVSRCISSCIKKFFTLRQKQKHAFMFAE